MLCDKFGDCECEEQMEQMCNWWGGWYCDSEINLCAVPEDPVHPEQDSIDWWRDQYCDTQNICTDCEYYDHLCDTFGKCGCEGYNALMCGWF